MKGRTLKPFILSALMFLFMIPAVSQKGNTSKYETSEDSINCGKHLSAYRSFFIIKYYEDAFPTWLKAFNDCPASSEMMYLDGVTMYHSFIEAAPEGPVREGLIDTLMLIYDRRMENFGGEGNVLGRKGRDLLTYRGADIEQVQKANEMLRKSTELKGKETQEAVLLLLISSGITLSKEEKIDDNQIIEDYLVVAGILGQLEGKSSRLKKTTAIIDKIMLKEDILSCEALKHYYEPKFEQNKNDKTFLEGAINAYTTSGCDSSDIFAAASENLYSIEPSPESAHNLAILFITRNEFKKAAGFLEEAVQGENIDRETRAEWYYELAVVNIANKEFCKAIEFAREAINLRSDYGKAYILLGDTFIASRDNLGDDFQQRTAFWAAADKYREAASVDPSLEEETNRKLTDYLGQYPNHEDVFFRDFKDGDPYLVEGCINEHTTVRSRK